MIVTDLARRGGLAAALLLTLWSGAAQAAFGLPDINLPSVPGVDALFREDPAITTSLADALTEVSWLDDFNPAATLPRSGLPLAARGQFKLVPGVLSYEAESFCLHAGKCGPSGGSGYVYAPLLGPMSGVIHNLIDGSFGRRDLRWQELQSLIWAIEAHAKLETLDPRLREVAQSVLSPADLQQLRGNVWKDLAPDVLDRAMAHLPAGAQEVFRAEARLRDMLTLPNVPFADLAAVAVPTGDPRPSKSDRQVPAGRWSYHPQGYFVRYLPEYYGHTHLDVCLPQPMQAQRDAQGRLTRLSDALGGAVELSYGDVAQAVPGEPTTVAWPLTRVRLVYPLLLGPAGAAEKVWEHQGWLLAGTPAGRAKLAAPPKGFPGLAERYRAALAEQAALQLQMRRISPKQPWPADALAALTELSQVRATLRSLVGTAQPDAVVAERLDAVTQAWMSLLAQTAGAAAPAVARPAVTAQAQPGGLFFAAWVPVANTAGPGAPGFDPGGNVATPGQTGRQRLGQSGRPLGFGDGAGGGAGGAGGGGGGGAGGGDSAADSFRRAVAAGLGVPADDVSVDTSANGLPRYCVRLGADGQPLPTLDAIAASNTTGNEGAKSLLIGTVQEANGNTRGVARTVDVETGVITSAGKGDVTGTGDGPTQQALAAARAAMGQPH